MRNALTHDDIQTYLAEVRRYPLLSPDEELTLSKRYWETGDVTAAHRLVVCNLRFVVKVANEYRNYGYRLLDLIQEGHIGLMTAVKKFDPRRGYRLITYAVWWIRAQIQSFILRSWSLVRIGTTRAQRRLFFQLRKKQRQLAQQNFEEPSVEALAAHFDVSVDDVADMQGKLAARDFSLDARGVNDDFTPWVESMPAATPTPESEVATREDLDLAHAIVDHAWPTLQPRERVLVRQRLLREEPVSLRKIGAGWGLSGERVRQLEVRTMQKLRAAYADLVATVPSHAS